MAKWLILVPYAYDYIEGKSGKGSCARCDAAIQASKNRLQSMMILTGGYTKASPCSPTSNRDKSLAEQMKWYVSTQDYRGIINASPCAWGTLAETKKAIEITRGLIEHAAGESVYKIVVSTNLGHLPRVLMCWHMLKPKDWKVEWVLAEHSFTSKEWAQETLKFLQYISLLIKERRSARIE